MNEIDAVTLIPLVDGTEQRNALLSLIESPTVKVSAAWLIEQSGFTKGFSLNGRAALSSKHTLAITNRGNATSADIAELAEHITSGVQAMFDIELKPEATFIY